MCARRAAGERECQYATSSAGVVILLTDIRLRFIRTSAPRFTPPCRVFPRLVFMTTRKPRREAIVPEERLLRTQTRPAGWLLLPRMDLRNYSPVWTSDRAPAADI